jgi:hypothetical protein
VDGLLAVPLAIFYGVMARSSRDCRAFSMERPRICGYSNTRFPWARLRRSAIERRLFGSSQALWVVSSDDCDSSRCGFESHPSPHSFSPQRGLASPLSCHVLRASTGYSSTIPGGRSDRGSHSKHRTTCSNQPGVSWIPDYRFNAWDAWRRIMISDASHPASRLEDDNTSLISSVPQCSGAGTSARN